MFPPRSPTSTPSKRARRSVARQAPALSCHTSTDFWAGVQNSSTPQSTPSAPRPVDPSSLSEEVKIWLPQDIKVYSEHIETKVVPDLQGEKWKEVDWKISARQVLQVPQKSKHFNDLRCNSLSVSLSVCRKLPTRFHNVQAPIFIGASTQPLQPPRNHPYTTFSATAGCFSSSRICGRGV